MSEVVCAKCGAEGGVFAVIKRLGPVVYCTPCRKVLAPEGWFWHFGFTPTLKENAR